MSIIHNSCFFYHYHHREKVKYESEVTAEEASLRIKQSEIKNIQNEIESLSQMLKQLESQKNDASRRLDDLNAQVWFFVLPLCLSLEGLIWCMRMALLV